MFDETDVNANSQAPAPEASSSTENAAQPATPEPAPAVMSKFDEAVAYVVSRLYSLESAKSIVEERGWRHILEDKEREAAASAPGLAPVADTTEMRPLNEVNDESAQQELPADSVKCPSCGVNYAKGDAGCPNCGTTKPH